MKDPRHIKNMNWLLGILGALFFMGILAGCASSQGERDPNTTQINQGGLINFYIVNVYKETSNEKVPNPRPVMIAEARSLITLARDKNEPLKVLVILAVTNRGVPSTLGDFYLRVTLKSGRELKTESLVTENLSIPKYGMQFDQHGDIYEKTGTKVIPTGGRVVGSHYSRLIDLGDHSNFQDARVELHFRDAFGNKYECRFRTDELEDRPFHVPGL